MFALFYLLLSGLLVYICARRATIIAPPTIWSFYIFMSLLVYEWVVRTGLTRRESVFSAMPLDHVALPYHTVFPVFVAIQVFMIVTTIGLPRPRSSIVFDTSMIMRYSHRLTSGAALLVLAGLWTVSAWHFAAIDHDVLWLNYEYKTIKDPLGIGASSVFARLYHFAFRFVGLAAIAAGVIYFHRGAWLHLILSAGLVAYALMFLLADNSRWVPIYFVCATMINYIISKRPLGILSLVAGILVFVTFVKVLVGRGMPEQGVSTILDSFSQISLANVPMYLEGFSINIFPSALNFANAILIDPSHPVEYKLKSFSPLLGFMDNFESTRLTSEVRLAPEVPMGALGEVFSFGWPYVIVFFIGSFVWLRSVTRLIIVNPVTGSLIMAVMSIYVIVTISSYSLRTSWRALIIITIIAFVLNQRHAIKMKRDARRRRAAMMRQA